VSIFTETYLKYVITVSDRRMINPRQLDISHLLEFY